MVEQLDLDGTVVGLLAKLESNGLKQRADAWTVCVPPGNFDVPQA